MRTAEVHTYIGKEEVSLRMSLRLDLFATTNRVRRRLRRIKKVAVRREYKDGARDQKPTERHYRIARTTGWREASCSSGRRGLLLIQTREILSELRCTRKERRYRKETQKRTSFRHLYKEKLLAFFRFSDMCRYEGILSKQVRSVGMFRYSRHAYHESLEIRPPPLGQAITNLPFVIKPVRRVELAGIGRRGKAVIKACFEAIDLVFTGF